MKKLDFKDNEVLNPHYIVGGGDEGGPVNDDKKGGKPKDDAPEEEGGGFWNWLKRIFTGPPKT